MSNDWTEAQDGFETTVETDTAKVIIDYFPLEHYANLRVLHPTNDDKEMIMEKIRFKARSSGPVKEATTVYDLYGSFWDTDEDGILSGGDDWEVEETIELKTDIELDVNPSENDIKVFEVLERIAKRMNYDDEISAAQEEGFCLPEIYEEDE